MKWLYISAPGPECDVTQSTMHVLIINIGKDKSTCFHVKAATDSIITVGAMTFNISS